MGDFDIDVDIDPARLAETDEQRELRAVLREFLADHSGPEEVRRHAASPRGHDEKLWSRLAGELGVHGLAIPERYGGAGFSFAELAVVLEETGRVLCCAPLLPTVVLAGFALLYSEDAEACERYLPRIADGGLTATFVGGSTVNAELAGGRWRLHGAVDFVLDGEQADLILVQARSPDGDRIFAWESTTDGCRRTPRRVLDQTRRQALIEFRGAPAIPVGTVAETAGAVVATVDTARAALAAEQVGGIAHALDATVSYVGQRKQFDRPIGSFQAVKHRLADLLVESEAARSAAAYAAACVTAASPGLPVAASAAATVCSAAYQRAAAEYVQLHGGIGFTWEHPAHLYLRRARSAEVLFGDRDFHLIRLAGLVGLG